jgi:hypothetical protein
MRGRPSRLPFASTIAKTQRLLLLGLIPVSAACVSRGGQEYGRRWAAHNFLGLEDRRQPGTSNRTMDDCIEEVAIALTPIHHLGKQPKSIGYTWKRNLDQRSKV